jgi:hypothetical protein
VADEERIAGCAQPEDALGRAGFEAAGGFDLPPAQPSLMTLLKGSRPPTIEPPSKR